MPHDPSSTLSTSALLLVLAAACAHATWNVLAHGVSRIGMPFLWWGAVSSSVLWLGLVPFTGGLGTDPPTFVAGVAVSGVLHVGYLLVLQRGYALGNLSTVYATARGSGPLVSVVVAVTVLGERPPAAALAGVVLVVAGVVMIGLLDRTAGTTGRSHALDPSTLYGLLTGVGIAAYTIWDAYVVRSLHLQPVAFMVGCTAVNAVLFGLLLGRRRAELLPVGRAHWPRVLAFGVFSPLAYILVLAAVRVAPVALVAPLREVSVVLVSLFGVLVLREARGGRRVLASVVVVGGIALLAI